MKDLLKQITTNSRWTHQAYDGLLHIQGRILSPAEANAAGVASSLIASDLATSRTSQEYAKLHKRIDGKDFSDIEESDMKMMMQMMKQIRPETLISMAEQQDKILCQVVIQASSDEGETWERLHLVLGESQQNPDQNRLWVGMLPEDDRKEMMRKALSGHRRASEKLATFRKG